MITTKIKFEVDETGFGKVWLNGQELEDVMALSCKVNPGELTEVNITFFAEVDGSIACHSDELAVRATRPAEYATTKSALLKKVRDPA